MEPPSGPEPGIEHANHSANRGYHVCSLLHMINTLTEYNPQNILLNSIPACTMPIVPGTPLYSYCTVIQYSHMENDSNNIILLVHKYTFPQYQ